MAFARAQSRPFGPIAYTAAQNLLMPDDSGLAIVARTSVHRGTDVNHKKLRRFYAEQYVGLWRVSTEPSARTFFRGWHMQVERMPPI